MALRTPLSTKRAGATANLCIIARHEPGLPTEVSEPQITRRLDGSVLGRVSSIRRQVHHGSVRGLLDLEPVNGPADRSEDQMKRVCSFRWRQPRLKSTGRGYWPTALTKDWRLAAGDGGPLEVRSFQKATDGRGSGGTTTKLRSPMSCSLVATDDDAACANCGKQGSDIVKLRNCNACRLVKYCGVDCQKAHRKQHKKTCKQRAAELRDEQLYSQGHERPEGESCSICTLPIPAPIPKDNAHALAMIRARVKKKDPEAIQMLGQKYFYGLGLQKDVRRAVELWTEAAELGSILALHNLGYACVPGKGVEKDMTKALQFWTKAAMQGHAESRYNLGCDEFQKENYHRAARHYLISAKMGHKDSIENIKKLFMTGFVTKEQYDDALKGYQDAVEEMTSHNRDEAKRLLGN
ncbi:hypothetical protein THAOC_23186 [Thalassiosira oceanica]|uniref:MYND-type domain-containing protein n=1 Tax=Thalassiosira oceanica TaxID=159749 RepID=K0RSQ0_THAOC|nr:hypothetical protein THAOC_23186 [Thalassiosira oceanica]|eukprot:EJK56843.1 hypothetical protein THAOC_23186 [Thalassiosira oceanica]